MPPRLPTPRRPVGPRPHARGVGLHARYACRAVVSGEVGKRLGDLGSPAMQASLLARLAPHAVARAAQSVPCTARDAGPGPLGQRHPHIPPGDSLRVERRPLGLNGLEHVFGSVASRALGTQRDHENTCERLFPQTLHTSAPSFVPVKPHPGHGAQLPTWH